MVLHAESLEDTLSRSRRAGRGPFFKVHRDERVTPVGRLLRTWSIDELPQLVNVLRGDMSLVGPRPLLMREHAELPEDVRTWRFALKPGLTGLWQVSGRSRTSDASRLRLDRLYVENASFAIDVLILARTPMAVLRAEGAV
jgi:lipopolysaccharide/colanic/teichoic acid biosynthesis glycosyltransferase